MGIWGTPPPQSDRPKMAVRPYVKGLLTIGFPMENWTINREKP